MEVAAGLSIAFIAGLIVYLCRNRSKFASLKKSSSNLSLSEMVQDEDPVVFKSKPKSDPTNLGS
jgi:hypothetical protein